MDDILKNAGKQMFDTIDLHCMDKKTLKCFLKYILYTTENNTGYTGLEQHEGDFILGFNIPLITNKKH